jgi:uncharacterized membrane protein YhaH (DUF805 family)
MGMVLKLLFSFNGRISVGWWWCGVVLCICLTLPFELLLYTAPVPVIASIFCVELLMVLALLTKRLHDLNKSAGWLLTYLIPVIGQLWLLVEQGFRHGRPAINRYGKKNNFMLKHSKYGYKAVSLSDDSVTQEKSHTTDIYQ